MTTYHLAQINIARMRAPLDSPIMAEFMHFVEPMNALAEQHPGFVWRLKEDGNDNATEVETPFGDDMIMNMSVWENAETLREFAYKTAHSYFVRHGQRWFEKMEQPHLVLWWVPAGHTPTVAEAAEKLALLNAHGPTAEAFNWAKFYAPSGELVKR